MATYTNQNSRGCGPVTRTKIRIYRSPSFSVQGGYVVVTWSLPLPKQSYCRDAGVSAVARQVQGTLFSEKLPLARFTCATVALELDGQAKLSQAGTTGTLVYQASMTLTRTGGAITISL
jgi:hypothetical protein